MENELNKTAIDQMFDIIKSLAEYSPENPLLQSLLAAKPRLKEVEKEQIKEAVNSQRQLGWDEKGEQYYEQTYGGNK
jgi:hypothetical protein